jgi:hypothetical protein
MKRVYRLKKDVVHDEVPSLVFRINRTQASNIRSVDLRGSMPPVYDQGELGSCTANAIAAAYEYDQIHQHEKSLFVPLQTIHLL